MIFLLKNGIIGGAGLDCVEEEEGEVTKALIEMPNVIITPHIGGTTSDLGSAIMSAETAIELLEDSGIDIRIADAPLIEGAIVAAVEASAGEDISAVVQAAEDAWQTRKLN